MQKFSFILEYLFIWPSLMAQTVKSLPAMWETHVQSLGDPCSITGSGRTPWRQKWGPTAVFLPGKCHGCSSLVGFTSWGCKESDTTE